MSRDHLRRHSVSWSSARRVTNSRPMAIGAVLFGLLVLLDLSLFGWLIFRSLSQREINRIILETRAEAEELADQLAEEAEKYGDDLYTAVATNARTQEYIDQVLSRRELVEVVRVYDAQQRLVFEGARVETLSGEEGARGAGDEPIALPPTVTEHFERDTPFETVEVPVGRVGTFVIGLRREEVEQRLQVLRSELIRQASVISLLSLALLGTAYGVIVRLVRKSRRLEDQAAEAERLAYVGTLASGLAHEIRSPLNSLNLNMQMLLEDLDSERGAPDEQSGSRRLLAITRDEISRLEHLVSDFLSYARPRDLDLEEVEAISLLEATRAVHRGRLALEGGELRVEDRSEGVRVRVDREQMQQLLLNLVENALQATACTDREPEVELRAEKHPAGVVLRVVDNGVGMTAEECAQAAEVFFSKRKGGTGLGLAIVDRIARNHDGRLEIESEPGVGTTVSVVLPRVEGPAGAQR